MSDQRVAWFRQKWPHLSHAIFRDELRDALAKTYSEWPHTSESIYRALTGEEWPST